MTVVFQSKFLLLQLKAPRACRIWNAEVRACSCRTEVGLKDKDLPHLNWSALIGDEPCSICPLCAGGVNLLLQIPWQEDQTDRQTASHCWAEEARAPCPAAWLGGSRNWSVPFCSVEQPTAERNYCVWYKHSLVLWETLS